MEYSQRPGASVSPHRDPLTLRAYWKLGVKPIEQPILAHQQVDTQKEKLTMIVKGFGLGCPKINRQDPASPMSAD